MHYKKKLKNILKETTVWAHITDASRLAVLTAKAEKKQVFVCDTAKALTTLRKILRVVTKVAANRGLILIYDPSYHGYQTQSNLVITNRWPNGYISNMHSRARFNETHMPDFVVILNSTEKHLKSVVYELSQAKIPFATIQKDIIPLAAYCACLSLRQRAFKRVIMRLLRRAIFQGNLLEIYSIKK